MNDNGQGTGGGELGVEAALLRTEYDRSTTPPSSAVVEAIAAVENVDPVELTANGDEPLYEYVDPDALDIVVADQRADGVTVTVTIDDYTVRVTDSEVVVQSTETDLAGTA